MKSSLIAGILSGTAGLLVFLVIHHVWIKPIWAIFPAGLFIAALGGLAVGWWVDRRWLVETYNRGARMSYNLEADYADKLEKAS